MTPAKSIVSDAGQNVPQKRTGFATGLQRLGSGHVINRDKTVRFTFDGQSYLGYQGDTLASALLANGVKRVGRSFKFHRPRGIFSAGIEEPNALVQLEQGAYAEPNVRATRQPLYEGLEARGQNAWPSVNWDLLSVLGWAQKLLPASFYYKSMFWPSWHFYEGTVRRLAGLGKAPTEADAQTYQQRNLHCELLVVGGGAAGLQAALEAAEEGGQVVLMDDQECLGGGLLDKRSEDLSDSSGQWLQQTLDTLRALPNVTLYPRTTVSGYYEHNFLIASERLANHLGPKANRDLPRERLWRIRAKRVVLATGAIERPLVFANNDRPGIMLASAVRTYLNRYGVAAGKQIVLTTNNDSAYQTVLDLQAAGITVVAVVDTRANIHGPMQEKLQALSIPLYSGQSIAKVQGRREVRGLTLSNGLKLNCDVIAVSGGWTPTVHLYSQAGGSLRYDDSKTCFVPKACDQAVTVVGAANGDFDSPADEQAIEPYWYNPDAPADQQWLDFQYDVKVSDIALAERENFSSVEHLKRYTTAGMSIDQGKTGNVNTLAVMGELSGRAIPDVGTTKFRPPFHPVNIGAFAGRRVGALLTPEQRLPAHDWHIAHGATMEDYGWRRPDYYLKPGESEADAIRRECMAVRNGVGLFDGSPLGKLEIKGPDAATFLNRIYINNAASLKPHRARYGLMCNENGVVIDDGVFVRLADDHYLLHTTSGNAAPIFNTLEEWLQCEWPELDVVVSNVTSQWATLTLSGPKARQVIDQLDSDIDCDREAFPHMHYRSGTVEGVPARILRASFTGEVSFEISVPARYGLSLWERLMELGQAQAITPYGVESLMVLRTEKGYLHIGVDTDGTTTPVDLGWGVPISKKADDFIGRRSLSLPNNQRNDRLHFVGLRAKHADETLPLGGHIVSSATPKIPVATQGYLTSACHSPTLNASVGLGLVQSGRERNGETVYIFANGNTVAAEIVDPAHLDPKGERLNG